MHGVVEQVLTAPAQRWSVDIDRVVTNRWLGIPIFFGLMYLVFSLVQNVATPYLDWVDRVFGGPLTAWVTALLGWMRAPNCWLISLATGGIIAGVGGVLVFLPGLFILCISPWLPWKTAAIWRAAFVMDRAMGKLGLHGRSFVPNGARLRLQRARHLCHPHDRES